MIKNLQCINCGVSGHTAKRCNSPITSYGIICYVKEQNDIKYIMVQRKDSLSYVEFMRGKYSLANRKYLRTIFSNMTTYEHHRIFTIPFEQLWNELWFDNSRKKPNSDYRNSFAKFERLQKGYVLRTKDASDILINFDYIREYLKTITPYEDTEWEFPKGRRQMNESDLDCALREFQEESGVPLAEITVLPHKPFEETYVGSNSIRYRNIYYTAKLKNPDYAKHIGIDKRNQTQMKEVRNVSLFDATEILTTIREIYLARKEVFRHIHSKIHNIRRRKV